ncbi:MAG: hypothetical protein EOP53_17550 [Sphingobacteriales bacterium]|nr:MAG: hypothetical protein EOP53_17550 [Sphingobacteriales bacterium]
MSAIHYPLNFTFKISTFSNDFIITDAGGNTLYFVRQKMFKFIEEVNVYSDETKNQQLYTINANKWIDFSAAYTFTNQLGNIIGSVARKGWASLWKAHYEVLDTSKHNDFIIREENAWVKVGDALLSEIPVLGIFTGYLFNPSYIVTNQNGDIIMRLKKEPSFFGRKFSLTKLGFVEEQQEERIILSLMMMILLERRRG